MDKKQLSPEMFMPLFALFFLAIALWLLLQLIKKYIEWAQHIRILAFTLSMFKIPYDRGWWWWLILLIPILVQFVFHTFGLIIWLIILGVRLIKAYRNSMRVDPSVYRSSSATDDTYDAMTKASVNLNQRMLNTRVDMLRRQLEKTHLVNKKNPGRSMTVMVGESWALYESFGLATYKAVTYQGGRDFDDTCKCIRYDDDPRYYIVNGRGIHVMTMQYDPTTFTMNILWVINYDS